MAAQVDVVERDFTIFEVAEAANEGRLLGAFAVRTAYFVNAVTQIDFLGQSISIDVNAVPHAALLRKWLSEIMYSIEKNGWTEIVEE